MVFRLRYTMFTVDFFFAVSRNRTKCIFLSWKITHFSKPDVVQIRTKSHFFRWKWHLFSPLFSSIPFTMSNHTRLKHTLRKLVHHNPTKPRTIFPAGTSKFRRRDSTSNRIQKCPLGADFHWYIDREVI